MSERHMEIQRDGHMNLDLEHIAFDIKAKRVPPQVGDDYLEHFHFLNSLCSPNAVSENMQFVSVLGLGRVALSASLLSAILTTHACMLFYLFTQQNSVGLEGTAWATHMVLWCSNMVMLCIFHLLEFLVSARFNPKVVSEELFLLNHSLSYKVAMVCGWLEFWLERFFLPSLKTSSRFFYLWFVMGLVMVVGGQSIRSLAIAQASNNFNHFVSVSKLPDHKLVTHGLYSKLRHPAYFGFFWWSVGTQVLLQNPVCTVLYFAASWHFFKDRIRFEEEQLLRFFRSEYPEYRLRTSTGIPFIR